MLERESVSRRLLRASPLALNAHSGSYALFERARAALNAGDTRAVLALPAQHARGFAGKLDTAARLRLGQRVCAEPTARAAPECVSLRSSRKAERALDARRNW